MSNRAIVKFVFMVINTLIPHIVVKKIKFCKMEIVKKIVVMGFIIKVSYVNVII